MISRTIWRATPAWLIAAALFGAGAWLRLRHLGAHDLGNDEIGLAFASPMASLTLENLSFNAPLPGVLTGLALALGRDVIGLRLLSLLPSLASMGVLYWLVRRQVGPWIALPFLALLALDPAQVWLALFGGAYGLIVLLQIALLDQTRRVERDPEATPLRGWWITAALLVYTHYLAWPLVVATALSLTVSAWRGTPAARRRWRRALLALLGVSAPLMLALLIGLVTHTDRAMTGGVATGEGPDLLGFLSGPSAPFGGWTPGVALGALALIPLAGLALRGATGAAALRYGAYLAALLLGLGLLSRMAPFQAALLQAPCLAVFWTAAWQLRRGGRRARITTGLLAALVTLGAPIAVAIPPVHSRDAAHVLSDQPYAPLTTMARALDHHPGARVLVYPPHHTLALAIHRHGSFDLDACEDDVDERGVIRAVSCPEGIVQGAWVRADRRVPDFTTAPSDRAVIAAIERARVWSLDFERPEEPIDWDARHVPPARLGLPASCQALVVPGWIAWTCPASPGHGDGATGD